jgi:probable HAF family extracellular repeat protein
MDTLTKTARILPRRSAVAVAVLAALALAAVPAWAAPAQARWEVVDLGTLPGGERSGSVAYGINNRGAVVGRSASDTSFEQAMVWRGGVMSALGASAFSGPPNVATAINDSGVAVGFAINSDGRDLATFWGSDGSVIGGWTLGSGGDVRFYGVNASGQAASTAFYDSGDWRPTVATTGTFRGLSIATSGNAVARAINDRGQVAGYSQAGRAVAWDAAGAQSLLPQLAGGGTLGDVALGINNAGAVVGRSGDRAALWASGGVIDLAVSNVVSSAAADISNLNVIVGNAQRADGSFAAFVNLPALGSFDAAQLTGAAAQGWSRLEEANAVNDRHQFVGYGVRAGTGAVRGYVATLAQTVWETRDSGGSWDTESSWSYGLAPTGAQHVVIDPTRAISVWGPRSAVEVKRLTVGGGRDGGGGVATLRLDGGTIQVVEDAADTSPGFRGMNIGTRGVLTGDGRIVVAPGGGRAVWNDGVILADAVRVEGTVVNRGVIGGALGQIAGAPRLEATFISNLGAFGSETGTGGVIRVLEGQQLQLEGNLRNSGDVQVFGGSFTHRGGWFNNDSITVPTGQDVGRILGQNARLDFQGGLGIYGGQLVFSAGNNNAFGSIVVGRSPADQRGGQIIVTGRSQATFYGGVDVGAGAELRISSGSVATFLGQVRQRTGALFTGSGTKFYEGGLAVGNSPGIGIDEGDVIFAGSNVYEAEIGGTTPGTGHDKLIVRGLLAFGGTLQLLSWQGYSGKIGDAYDLFDWGTTEGQFDAIDTSAFLLAPGARLDFSRLYVDGTVAIAAVPEPGAWALMALGLGAVVWCARRRAEPGKGVPA